MNDLVDLTYRLTACSSWSIGRREVSIFTVTGDPAGFIRQLTPISSRSSLKVLRHVFFGLPLFRGSPDRKCLQDMLSSGMAIHHNPNEVLLGGFGVGDKLPNPEQNIIHPSARSSSSGII